MKQSLPARVVTYALIITGLGFVVLPFLYMVATSLTRYAYTLPFPPRLWPEHPTLENFVTAWTTENFQLYTLNTLVVAVATTAVVLMVCSMLAYAFARFEFAGKEAIFRLLVASMMIPGMITLIPTFLVMRDFHLLDSLTGLVTIQTSTTLAFSTFLLRGFFEQLPRELEDAVRVDGGSAWTVYWRIMLPLAQPALATVAIMTFLGAWDEYYWPLILINDQLKRTLPIALRIFQGMYLTNWSVVFAASLIAMLPELLVFAFFQRYFVQGLTAGANKG